jgi:hypothetical protein
MKFKNKSYIQYRWITYRVLKKLSCYHIKTGNKTNHLAAPVPEKEELFALAVQAPATREDVGFGSNARSRIIGTSIINRSVFCRKSTDEKGSHTQWSTQFWGLNKKIVGVSVKHNWCAFFPTFCSCWFRKDAGGRGGTGGVGEGGRWWLIREWCSVRASWRGSWRVHPRHPTGGLAQRRPDPEDSAPLAASPYLPGNNRFIWSTL